MLRVVVGRVVVPAPPQDAGPCAGEDTDRVGVVAAAGAGGAIDGGSPGMGVAGVVVLREAVALDTTFAMAYRKLAVALSNAGRPRAEVDSALEQAYRHRDRLTERERQVTIGTYAHLHTRRDRARAVRAYEAVLALDPMESAALNNLANLLGERREFARAEGRFRPAGTRR
jgi:hypothetical protein